MKACTEIILDFHESIQISQYHVRSILSKGQRKSSKSKRIAKETFLKLNLNENPVYCICCYILGLNTFASKPKKVVCFHTELHACSCISPESTTLIGISITAHVWPFFVCFCFSHPLIIFARRRDQGLIQRSCFDSIAANMAC